MTKEDHSEKRGAAKKKKRNGYQKSTLSAGANVRQHRGHTEKEGRTPRDVFGCRREQYQEQSEERKLEKNYDLLTAEREFWLKNTCARRGRRGGG